MSKGNSCLLQAWSTCLGGVLDVLSPNLLLMGFRFVLGLMGVFLLQHPHYISSPESIMHFDGVSVATSELQGNRLYFCVLTRKQD